MPELRGLPGVRRRIAISRYASSPGTAIAIMRKDGAATAAGDNGALTCWRDDKGTLRSRFSRYMATVDDAEHRTVASLRAWLNEWFPRLSRS